MCHLFRYLFGTLQLQPDSRSIKQRPTSFLRSLPRRRFSAFFFAFFFLHLIDFLFSLKGPQAIYSSYFVNINLPVMTDRLVWQLLKKLHDRGHKSFLLFLLKEALFFSPIWMSAARDPLLLLQLLCGLCSVQPQGI